MPESSDSNGDALAYYQIPHNVLAVHKAIRFCGVVDKLGYFVAQKYRSDISSPVLPDPENAKYALLTAIRGRPNKTFQSMVGKTYYNMARSEKLIQAAVSLPDSHLLIVYFEPSSGINYDQIIMEKILPIINQAAFDGQGWYER